MRVIKESPVREAPDHRDHDQTGSDKRTRNGQRRRQESAATVQAGKYDGNGPDQTARHSGEYGPHKELQPSVAELYDAIN